MTLDTSAAPPAPGARNATLEDLAALLRDQQARKLDIVAPATAVHAVGARLVVEGTAPVLGMDGVTMTDGAYAPTDVCDQGIADKLGIPAAYLRKMREQKPGLYDANVNGWLAGDDRRFLLRCLRGEGGGGIVRAFLSDGYKIIDNLDVLLAALDGVRQSGYPVRIDGCDLTQRRMYVRVVCEQVAALAPAMLAGYRSPFTGAAGADNPVVFSGFVLTNSETGCGAFTLTPRLVVQVCDNGLTITKDAMRAVHLGERHEEGVVTWSGSTLDKTLALITAKTTDAVTTFLDPGYVQRAVQAIEKDAGHPVPDPQETIRTVSARLRFTDAQQAGILGHFIRGGQLTAGGVMQAVTSVAQTLTDADAAHEMESLALRALDLAAAL
ncbi:MAG TPA: DUF932 domain-containing protein [Streptosporangiaceae bacterium]|nr:DUF932 domain-containing protein [Streptosporangiaceae bacterium]